MATHPSLSRPVDATAQKPTKARYWVIVFAVTLAILAYIDRVAFRWRRRKFARPGPHEGADGLGLRGVCVGLRAVRNPGRLAGRLNRAAQSVDARRVWWSAFTAATGFMWNFGTMLWDALFLWRG